MSSFKRGLGKSFDKIFGEGKVDETKVSEINKPKENELIENIQNNEVEKEQKVGTPLSVNINFVQANPNQPRKLFDEEKLKELSESIEMYGIIEPLIVRKVGPVHYEVIAGERRLRAAKMAGLTEVPVIVKEYSDDERKIVTILENVQREDLNAVEKAIGYKALITEYNLTQEELAVKVGKSRSAIANALRILTLDENIINMIIDGTLTEGHARALLSIEDNAFREKVAKKVIEEKMSVRKIEDMIRLEKLATDRKRKDAKFDTESMKAVKIQIKDIEKQMRNKLGAALKINMKNEQSGIIEIKYTTQEELDRIYTLINSINQ